jgi:hypothetical protein
LCHGFFLFLFYLNEFFFGDFCFYLIYFDISVVIVHHLCTYVEGIWSIEPNRFLDRFGGGGYGRQWRRHLCRSSFSSAVVVDCGGGHNSGHIYRPSVHGFYTVFTTPVSFFSWQ